MPKVPITSAKVLLFKIINYTLIKYLACMLMAAFSDLWCEWQSSWILVLNRSCECRGVCEASRSRRRRAAPSQNQRFHISALRALAKIHVVAWKPYMLCTHWQRGQVHKHQHTLCCYVVADCLPASFVGSAAIIRVPLEILIFNISCIYWLQRVWSEWQDDSLPRQSNVKIEWRQACFCYFCCFDSMTLTLCYTYTLPSVEVRLRLTLPSSALPHTYWFSDFLFCERRRDSEEI